MSNAGNGYMTVLVMAMTGRKATGTEENFSAIPLRMRSVIITRSRQPQTDTQSVFKETT